MAIVEVSLETGAVIAAFAGVLGGLWGGMVSVRAATRGPQWALDYLKRSFPLLLSLVVASVLVMLLVSPGWLGLALIYVTSIIAWMARSVSRSLEKVRAAGTFDPLPPHRQAAPCTSGTWTTTAPECSGDGTGRPGSPWPCTMPTIARSPTLRSAGVGQAATRAAASAPPMAVAPVRSQRATSGAASPGPPLQ